MNSEEKSLVSKVNRYISLGKKLGKPEYYYPNGAIINLFKLILIHKYGNTCNTNDDNFFTETLFETMISGEQNEQEDYLNRHAAVLLNCIQNSKEVFVVPIGFISKQASGGHANMLVYRKHDNAFELFEPHGKEFGIPKESIEVNDILQSLINKMNELKDESMPEIKYLSREPFCPVLPTGFQNYSDNAPGDVIKGTCLSWSSLIGSLVLEHPSLSSQKIIDIVTKTVAKDGEIQNFVHLINGFIQHHFKNMNVYLGLLLSSNIQDLHLQDIKLIKKMFDNTPGTANYKNVFTGDIQQTMDIVQNLINNIDTQLQTIEPEIEQLKPDYLIVAEEKNMIVEKISSIKMMLEGFEEFASNADIHHELLSSSKEELAPFKKILYSTNVFELIDLDDDSDFGDSDFDLEDKYADYDINKDTFFQDLSDKLKLFREQLAEFQENNQIDKHDKIEEYNKYVELDNQKSKLLFDKMSNLIILDELQLIKENPSPNVSPKNSPLVSSAVTKKRGRPKKESLPGEEGQTIPASTKKRGRTKKESLLGEEGQTIPASTKKRAFPATSNENGSPSMPTATKKRRITSPITEEEKEQIIRLYSRLPNGEKILADFNNLTSIQQKKKYDQLSKFFKKGGGTQKNRNKHKKIYRR